MPGSKVHISQRLSIRGRPASMHLAGRGGRGEARSTLIESDLGFPLKLLLLFYRASKRPPSRALFEFLGGEKALQYPKVDVIQEPKRVAPSIILSATD